MIRPLTFTLLLCCGIATAVGHAEELTVSERSRGTMINDRDIVKNIQNQLTTDREQQFEHCKVLSFNQIVLLTGQVDSQNLRDEATKIAAQIPLVRRVHNYLNISGAPSAISRMADWWVSMRVKRAIRKLDIQGETQIRINHGKLYILGLVTQEEGSQISEAVRHTKGVTHVIALFEYL